MMAKAPCLDCPQRHVGCHAECEKYLAYDALKKEERKARHKKSPAIGFAVDSIERKRHIRENSKPR